MKIGCWAAALGSCDAKLSGEHIVSASLWTGPTVTASGGPFGDGREVGVANLTAKVLCRQHNSALSELDAAGATAFATITEEVRLTNARLQPSPRAWIPQRFSVDGPRLERWFIKTAINIALMLKKQPTWSIDGTTGHPPRILVESAFGITTPARPLGLYAAASVGEEMSSREEVRCQLLFGDKDAIAGASFLFRGLNFVVNLTNTEMLGILSGADGSVIRPQKDLLYHIGRINADVAGYRSHFLDFNWPGSTPDHFAL